MDYNPTRVARAILAIQRAQRVEGERLTAPQLARYILDHLPRDIPLSVVYDACLIAAATLEARAAQIRASKGGPHS